MMAKLGFCKQRRAIAEGLADAKDLGEFPMGVTSNRGRQIEVGYVKSSNLMSVLGCISETIQDRDIP